MSEFREADDGTTTAPRIDELRRAELAALEANHTHVHGVATDTGFAVAFEAATRLGFPDATVDGEEGQQARLALQKERARIVRTMIGDVVGLPVEVLDALASNRRSEFEE